MRKQQGFNAVAKSARQFSHAMQIFLVFIHLENNPLN